MSSHHTPDAFGAAPGADPRSSVRSRRRSSGRTVGGLLAAGTAALAVAGVAVAASLGLFPGGGSPVAAPAPVTSTASPSAEVDASPELHEGTPAPEDTPGPEATEDPASPDAAPEPTPTQPVAPTPAPQPSTPSAPQPTVPPETEPAVLAVGSAELSEAGELVLTVSGAPAREVQASVRADETADDAGSADDAVEAGEEVEANEQAVAPQETSAGTALDADGTGTLSLALTRAQAEADATVELSYVGEPESIVAHRLSELGDVRAQALEILEPTASPTPTPTPTPTTTADPTPSPTPTREATCGDDWWPWGDDGTCLLVTVDDVEEGSVILVATKEQQYRLEDGTASFAIDLAWTDPTDRVTVTSPDGQVRNLGTVGELSAAR